MSYTVHMTVPPGTGPRRQDIAPWNDEVYADPAAAVEVARDAYDSRDRRRDVLVLDSDGGVWDWFKAEPAPTHPLIGDNRPVHFTRTEVQRMIARLTEWTRALPEPVAEIADLLAERLADTDRMLAAWDGTTPDEETER